MNYEQLMPYLKAAELNTRMNTAQMIANRVNHDPNLEPYLDDIAIALADENEHIRFNLAYALVSAAEKGIDITKVIPQLVVLLDDVLVKTQKEAVWALVCLACSGKSIAPAIEKLEDCIANPNNLTGNGSIALTAHYLFNKEEKKALDLLDVKHAHTRFGVAYAATMYCIITKEKEAFKKVLNRIKVGLSDRDLITGVAGALLWAEDNLGLDYSIAAEAIGEVQKEAKDDVMQEAALGGIFMNMSIQRRK